MKLPDSKFKLSLTLVCREMPVITRTRIKVQVMKNIFSRHVTWGVNHTYIKINPMKVNVYGSIMTNTTVIRLWPMGFQKPRNTC